MSGFGGGTLAESNGGESQLNNTNNFNSTSKSTKNRLGFLATLDDVGRGRKQSLVSVSAGALPHWGYATIDTPTISSLSPTNRASSTTFHTQLFGGQTPLASANTPRLNNIKFKFLDRAGEDYPLEGGGYGSSPHTRPTTAASFSNSPTSANRENSGAGGDYVGPLYSCSSGNSSSLQSPADATRLHPPPRVSTSKPSPQPNHHHLHTNSHQPVLAGYPGDDDSNEHSPSSSSSFLSPVEGGGGLEAESYKNKNNNSNNNSRGDDFSDASEEVELDSRSGRDRHLQQDKGSFSPPREAMNHTPPPPKQSQQQPPTTQSISPAGQRSLPPFLAVPVVLSLLRPQGATSKQDQLPPATHNDENGESGKS
eukprot:TRINITY_DN56355_c0_g3_i2.p1 TRINITY_DN56355_c0_g3~~TRINITY_DN56355_c0_g3_i2.p1  ORF type:complete len:367 (+),score=55.08 TRINITY_DN56355_c0_g3_i2:225-1325(+)